MPRLYAGVGRVTITPPVGIDLMGTSWRSQPSDGIHQDLYATCLVLATEEQRVVLVDCDLLAIPIQAANEYRRRIGAILGVPTEHVLLACTHTHNAPVTSLSMTKVGGDQTGLSELERVYVAQLGYLLEGAARQAGSRLEPAWLAAGAGQLDIIMNRREQLEDGTVVLGRNVNGPRDPSLAVLRVDTEAGTPLAALLTFAVHPGAIGPHCRLISPDIVGEVRRTVEAMTGATALYFSGAAANMMLLRRLHPGPSVAETVGRQIGCEASAVFLGLNTQPTETRWSFLQSVSRLKMYEDVPVDRPAVTHFGVATRHISLDLRPLPAMAEAESLLTAKRARVQQLQTDGVSPDDLNPALFQMLWAERLVEGLRQGDAPRAVQAELQVIRLDDIALVAIPGEPFVEMGLAIKARSPLRRTFVIGYANGTVGYIPTRDAYPLGGYEVEEAYKVYGFPTALAPGAAEHIVDTCLELLGELT